jgi:P4 family phage/plasmid primase-like protien
MKEDIAPKAQEAPAPLQAYPGEPGTSRRDYSFERCIELYEPWISQLQELIDHRAEFGDHPDPVLKPRQDILRIWDLSQSYKESDPDLSGLLYATALFYYYQSEAIDEPEFVIETEKGQVLNYNVITDYFIRKYFIISFDKTTYLYIHGYGQFFPDNKERLSGDITKLLKTIGYTDNKQCRTTCDDIVIRIRRETRKTADPFNKKMGDYIPVRNGVISVDSAVLFPKSPLWGFTYALPVKYDPEADDTEVREFISSIVKPSDVKGLIEAPALALKRENWQRTYLLYGNGVNAKGTYTKLVRQVIGPNNVSAETLQNIMMGRFSAAELVDKLMNICPDLEKNKITSTGKFKAITGHDEISVERKFKDPVKAVIPAVITVSANLLPEVEDSSDAFFRRWWAIEFPHKFKVNPEFERCLINNETNLSAFLNLILDRMRDIKINGLDEEDAERSRIIWMKRSDTAYMYIVEEWQADNQDSIVPLNPTYDSYRSWCFERGFDPKTNNLFREALKNHGYKISRPWINRVRTWVIHGIKAINYLY